MAEPFPPSFPAPPGPPGPPVPGQPGGKCEDCVYTALPSDYCLCASQLNDPVIGSACKVTKLVYTIVVEFV